MRELKDVSSWHYFGWSRQRKRRPALLIVTAIALVHCSVVWAKGEVLSQQDAIRINVGGDSFVDRLGRFWTADQGFNAGRKSVTKKPISGTKDDVLYRTKRWRPAKAGPLVYRVPVENGEYRLRLHFAETFSGASAEGKRVFDVRAEGKVALRNVDVFAQAHGNAALVKMVPVLVTDGRLDIRFTARVRNPIVSAIEIVPASDKRDTDSNVGSLLNLTWEAGPPSVGAYVVYFGVAPDRTTQPVAELSSLSASFDRSAPSVELHSTHDLGLRDGDQACFRVRSKGRHGLSEPSPPVCVRI